MWSGGGLSIAAAWLLCSGAVTAQLHHTLHQSPHPVEGLWLYDTHQNPNVNVTGLDHLTSANILQPISRAGLYEKCPRQQLISCLKHDVKDN